MFQKNKVNHKLLVGESEYINEHFAAHGQNAVSGAQGFLCGA
jgi:hypothetical protein